MTEKIKAIEHSKDPLAQYLWSKMKSTLDFKRFISLVIRQIKNPKIADPRSPECTHSALTFMLTGWALIAATCVSAEFIVTHFATPRVVLHLRELEHLNDTWKSDISLYELNRYRELFPIKIEQMKKALSEHSVRTTTLGPLSIFFASYIFYFIFYSKKNETNIKWLHIFFMNYIFSCSFFPALYIAFGEQMAVLSRHFKLPGYIEFWVANRDLFSIPLCLPFVLISLRGVALVYDIRPWKTWSATTLSNLIGAAMALYALNIADALKNQLLYPHWK